MNIVFAGTPPFAATLLKALLEAGHRVPLVLTQPDKPAGRGMALSSSAVKLVALEKNINIAQPVSLKTPESQRLVLDLSPDVFIVAAYGLMIPAPLLAIGTWGALNVHTSLLPRWRGAAPIERAIEAGDDKTGICIMQMSEGLDTGPIFSQVTTPIEENETATALEARMAALAADALLRFLAHPDSKSLTPVPQSLEGITYAHKIKSADGRLDFSRSALALNNQIRAFADGVGCYFDCAIPDIHSDSSRAAQKSAITETLRIGSAHISTLAASTLSAQKPCIGEVLSINAEGIHVQCGDGILCIKTLQRAGRKMIAARDAANGLRFKVGSVLIAK